MDIRDLTYFMAVAQELNFSKAANLLHMTQPPLSRQIKALEDELGVDLFSRKNGSRQLQLTESGILLRSMAGEIINLTEKARDQLSEQKEGVRGTLYIGCIISGSSMILPEIIREFHEICPNVVFSLTFGNGDDIMEQMEKGLIDFVVNYAPCSSEIYEVFHLGSERWIAAIPADHPLASETSSVKFGDLSGCPLILPGRPVRYRAVMERFAENGVSPDVLATYTTSAGVISLVSAGLGIALVPEPFSQLINPNDIRCRMLEPSFQSELILAWRKRSAHSNVARRFMEYVLNSKKWGHA